MNIDKYENLTVKELKKIIKDADDNSTLKELLKHTKDEDFNVNFLFYFSDESPDNFSINLTYLEKQNDTLFKFSQCVKSLLLEDKTYMSVDYELFGMIWDYLDKKNVKVIKPAIIHHNFTLYQDDSFNKTFQLYQYE